MKFGQKLNTHKIFKRIAKALIRLHVQLYAQADLRLCWTHILHCWKSHVAAHFRTFYVKSFEKHKKKNQKFDMFIYFLMLRIIKKVS